MFPGILLFNPSLLQILFPTVAISKECSFLRTQPKVSIILTRCPGTLFYTETSGSPDQFYPLFHFWLLLFGADNSCSEPLIAPQMLLPSFSPPPLYITTFPSSHCAPDHLNSKKMQIRGRKWFIPAYKLQSITEGRQNSSRKLEQKPQEKATCWI